MNEIEKICEAIRNKKIITFYYKEGIRTVEPYLVGNHATTGRMTLRAFFIDGFSKSGRYNTWKLYSVEEIENVVINDSIFSGDRIEYNPDDKAISEILERV